MGTNYYLHQKPDCECCGRPFEPLHIGELVEIEIQIAHDEWVVKSGRVKDVIWTVRREPMASVLLGA